MKIRYYLWIFISLLVISGGLLLFGDRWSSGGNEFKDILPGETKGVNAIKILSVYDSISFVQKEGLWYYGKELLNQKAVNNLVLASGSLTMKSIIPWEKFGNADMQVELILHQGKKESGRYFFAKKDQNYYIFNANSSKVFGVELAGYENMPLEKIFSVSLDHYRQHLLIDLLPSEIKSIDIQPYKGDAFRAVQDSSFNIAVFRKDGETEITNALDLRKIRLLFSYFNAIRYQAIDEAAESVLPDLPFAKVVVRDFQGNTYIFEVYTWLKAGEEKADIFKALVLFNDKPSRLIVDYYYLDLIIRGMESYLSN